MRNDRRNGISADHVQTYTVADIATILNIGRNAAYKLVNSGEFQVVRIGKTIRVSKKSFHAWLEETAN